MNQAELDRHFMEQAIEQAKLAALAGEVPVGAVVVREGKVLAKAFNKPISNHDPSAHAEMLALREAALTEENYRLPGTTLYVTLEPCLMCAGALYWNKIGHIVFGAFDEKNSYRRVTEKNPFHPSTTLTGGILQEECAALMQAFFKAKR